MKYTMEEITAEIKKVLKANNCHGRVVIERKGKAKAEVFVDGIFYGTYDMDKHDFID